MVAFNFVYCQQSLTAAVPNITVSRFASALLCSAGGNGCCYCEYQCNNE